MKKHGTALIVGGTGMLATASRWLIARSEATALVARHASDFAADQEAVFPFDTDWDAPDFITQLRGVLDKLTGAQRALLWLHEPATLLPKLLPLIPAARIVLVLGGRHEIGSIPEQGRDIAIVRLGSKPTPTGRRWLTHEEISEGAIAALGDGRSRVVGEWVPSSSE